ncbi:MAG TPA: ABC transporter permease [Candidatus Saccharimonadales bacterium]|nr:ABC transporter permease [Candidatus Saccharimonadales bacterium]
MKKPVYYLPAFAVFAALLLVWQAYTHAGLIDKLVLPAPSDVWHALINYRSVIWGHTAQTLLETVEGLILAIILGVLSGSAIYMSGLLKKAVYPLLIASQTIPIIALAPLMIIWFGFGIVPKVIIVVLICFFPITVAVSDGLEQTPAHLVDLAKSMGASRLKILRYIEFPSALPAFFSGLKISTTYAVTGAIVGEYVGAYQGLGIFMQTAAHSRAIELVFASIFVIIILTLVLLGLVFAAQRAAMPWRYKDHV